MYPQGAKEALLTQAARDGDRRAFERLVRANQRRVYSLALRMLGNAEDAEDVLQETFLALFRSLHAFRGGSRLSTYLHRTAVNFCMMKLRQRRRRREGQHLTLEQAAENPDPRAFSLEGLMESEKRALLNRLLMGLGQGERAAVVLSDIEGISNAEASRIMGVSLPAFKSRLRRGREGLRKKLLPYIGKP
jgi:RNA polymerase sigma-70 factor (ECF subfamily)